MRAGSPSPAAAPATPEVPAAAAGGSVTVFSVLLAINATHLLYDTVQSLIPAL